MVHHSSDNKTSSRQLPPPQIHKSRIAAADVRRYVLRVRPFLAIFFCKLLCILHKLLPVFSVLLRQVGTQWMLGLRVANESYERL